MKDKRKPPADNAGKSAAVGEEFPALPPTLTAARYAALDDAAKGAYRPVDPRYERLPLFSWILYGVALVCLLLYVVQVNSPAFADWFNSTVSAGVRAFLAALTTWIPFSLGECCILLLPVALVFAVRHAIRHRCDTWRTAGVYIGILLSVVVSVFSIFALDSTAGYRGKPLDEKLGLEQAEVSPEELYDTAMILISGINAETANVQFGEDGFSVMPYSFSRMNEHLGEAYAAFCADHDFITHTESAVKPVLLSEVMSYMHITGVYSFFTGEANVNVNFPDYTIPYTAAHELAHQRGIARENEANFIAFLVCAGSEDSYVRYSGYLNLYEYVSSALYRADKELYYKANAHLNEEVRAEMAAYNRFYEKYRESTVSQVSGAVNNTYLQTQGTPVGSRSYGMVVDLAVAHYKKQP